MIKNPDNIKNMIISILACKRPRHLYVTLDSIFKMNGIEEYPVNIMIVYNDKEILEQQLYYIAQFPISSIEILYEKPNCGDNHLSQFEYLSGLSYDWFLLAEDDIIFRPDALDYLRSIEKHAFVYVLYNKKIEDGDIRPLLIYGEGNCFANLYNKTSLEILTKWLSANMSNGLPTHLQNTSDFIYENRPCIEYGNDVKDHAFFHKMDIIESVPSKSMVLHFGLNTSIKDDIRNELETEMFAGGKEQWLGNILGVLDRNRENPEITRILRPYCFKYED